MILYLLVPALVLGDVQVRDTWAEEAGQFRINQTINQTINQLIDDHSWRKPDNTTFSLYEEESTRDEEERTLVEKELQSNTTFDLVTEDEETFQDQENLVPGVQCDRELLLELSHTYCGGGFHQEMMELSADDWCVLDNVIRPYNDLTICLERLTHFVGCFFPNADVQDIFVHVHSLYFQSCRQEAPLQEDAPHGLVVALTLLPVSLVPVLVSILVCKSKAAA